MSGLMLEYLQQQINKMGSALTSQSTLSVNSANTLASNLPAPMPLSSGYASELSSSLASIASISTQYFNANNATNNSNMSSWTNANRRQESSLYSSLITSHLTQFTKFMYSHSIMFKSDNLIGIHFNQSVNQLLMSNVNSGNLNFEPLDYMTSSMHSSSLSISSIGSTSSSINTNLKAQQQYLFASTATAAAAASITSSTISKMNPLSSSTTSSSSPFKLLSFMRKSKPDQNAINLQQQQQAQKELQQQKIKQQKTDLKTIAQYIKSFETIVIKSLRQYTLTTSVNLQTRILELLIQLIFLKGTIVSLTQTKSSLTMYSSNSSISSRNARPAAAAQITCPSRISSICTNPSNRNRAPPIP
jgi:hypothetical protein